MNIFFDLDGTLIDSKPRLYNLFNYLVYESDLSFEKYWELKGNKINHKQILQKRYNYSNEQYKVFEEKWMAEIELKKWLSLDKPFEGVDKLLSELSKKHNLHIITARQNVKNTLYQLKSFNWYKYIDHTLITQQKITKEDIINQRIKVSNEDWFIGDTGNDIEVGKKLGVNTVAVLSGFLNKVKILEYQPDIIVSNVAEIDFFDIN